MKTNTLNAEEAAAILFGDQFDYAGFEPETATFASGADVCEWLAAHFGFTDADYRALHVERLVRFGRERASHDAQQSHLG